MNRRGFLKLLGLLPFVPALAEAAAKTISKPALDFRRSGKTFVTMDRALSGSDQTSIWFTEWDPVIDKYAYDLGVNPSLLDLANKYKRDDDLLPMTEILNRKNPFLQEMTWKEGKLTPGHRLTMGTPYPLVPFRRRS